MKQAVAAAALTLALSTTAQAASILPADGVASGIDRLEVHPVTQGLASIVGDFEVIGFEPEGRGNPLAGLHGPCFGAMELNQNRLSGSGYCTFTDAGGEAVVLRWTALAPVTRGYRGTWDLVGGSGWWSDARGSGTYVHLVNPESRRFNAGITGQITKP